MLRVLAVSSGEMSEWFKELVLKTSDPARGRGFESHSLRHFLNCCEFDLEKYPRGRRGSPAKGVGRETGARVQIPPSAPQETALFVGNRAVSSFIMLLFPRKSSCLLFLFFRLPLNLPPTECLLHQTTRSGVFLCFWVVKDP